jgi:hypothetical protein
VIYTAGRDPEAQKTVVSDKKPLITAPLIVCDESCKPVNLSHYYVILHLALIRILIIVAGNGK